MHGLTYAELAVEHDRCRAEIERLRAALEKYGCHSFSCNIGPNHPCDCGWDAIQDEELPTAEYVRGILNEQLATPENYVRQSGGATTRFEALAI